MTILSAYLYLLIKSNPSKAIFIGYFSYIILGWIFLSMSFLQKNLFHGIDSLFMSQWSIGTIGTSMYITGDLNFSAKFLLIILMLMGRVGILTFGMALSSERRQ